MAGDALEQRHGAGAAIDADLRSVCDGFVAVLVPTTAGMPGNDVKTKRLVKLPAVLRREPG